MIENDCAMIKATKEYQDVVEAYGFSPTKWWNKRQLNARNTWNIPDHLCELQLIIYLVCILFANDLLVCLWDDLELVTARDGSTHPLFPMRIESLLLALLADKIKKESRNPHGSLNSPHWSFRKRISTLGMEYDKGIAPENIIDYVLWYGHCLELETNMIVMKSKSPVPQSWALLQNMASIHDARKLAERDAVIYGVITDGSKWVFIHLTNKSRVGGFGSPGVFEGSLGNLFTDASFLVYNQGILLGRREVPDYCPGPGYNRPGSCSSQKDTAALFSAYAYCLSN